jgi:hypothetical protein
MWFCGPAAARMPPDTAGRMPAAMENRRECATARMLVGEPEEMEDGRFAHRKQRMVLL